MVDMCKLWEYEADVLNPYYMVIRALPSALDMMTTSCIAMVLVGHLTWYYA